MAVFGYQNLGFGGGEQLPPADVVEAISFNGTSSRLLTNGSFPYSGSSDRDATVSFWIKPAFASGSPGSPNVDYIMHQRNLAGEFYFKLTYDGTDIDLEIYVADLSPNPDVTYTQTISNAVANNNWSHILFSFDGRSGSGTTHTDLYINDSKQTVSDVPINMLVGRSGYVIGRSAFGFNYYQGCLAEVVTYNQYHDLDVASNRRKFITVTGKPATIDTTDANIKMYLTGNATTFSDQVGSLAFYEKTDITDCADSPSD